ncbi:MAG: hypothetical protein ACR2OU_13550 [Thermomicrobiales bacterium]
MPEANLLMIIGQEGAGKSTTVRALGEATPSSGRLDAEDVAATNPWQMDEAFLQLLWKNVADVTRNFWEAGYQTVIAGSFASNIGHYHAFREILNRDANVYVVQLCAGKPVRNVRRIERGKATSEEWRDMVDRVDPEDTTFASSATNGEYRFLRIDIEGTSVADTIERIRQWAPELYEVR